MTTGQRMKKRRKEIGLSAERVAMALGVSPATVYRYENGDIEKVPGDLLEPIAAVLQTTPSALMGWEENPKIESGFISQEKKENLILNKISNISPIDSGLSGHKEKNCPSMSDEAVKLARDYDRLDNHGQRVVRIVTDEEKARMAVELQKQHSQADTIREKTYFMVPEYFLPMSAGTGVEAGDEPPEDLALIKKPPYGTSFVARVSGNSMEPTYCDGDKLFIRACNDINAGQIGVFFMDGQQWVKELGNGVLLSHNPDYPPIPISEDTCCQGLVLGICDESYFEH